MSDSQQPPTPPREPSTQPADAYGAAPAYGSVPTSAPADGTVASAQYAESPRYNVSERYNVLAIVSFVSSFFIQLVAVITGHIALGQIKTSGEKGRGFAIAGLIIGYAGILLSIIAVAIFLPLMLTVFSNPNVMSGY